MSQAKEAGLQFIVRISVVSVEPNDTQGIGEALKCLHGPVRLLGVEWRGGLLLADCAVRATSRDEAVSLTAEGARSALGTLPSSSRYELRYETRGLLRTDAPPRSHAPARWWNGLRVALSGPDALGDTEIAAVRARIWDWPQTRNLQISWDNNQGAVVLTADVSQASENEAIDFLMELVFNAVNTTIELSEEEEARDWRTFSLDPKHGLDPKHDRRTD